MKIVVKELEENHNVSKKSDLKVFFKFVSIFVGVIVLLFFSLLIFASFLTNFVSLEDEKRYFGGLTSLDISIEKEQTKKLKDFLGKDFKYDIKVIKLDEANAFALPGGTIAITNTMLEDINYENSLLFIIGHEIGHIENRDILKSVISKVPIQILLSLIGIGGDIDLSFIFSGTSDIHTKTIETKADIRGLEFLNNKNGSVECAINYFQKDLDLKKNIMSFLSDHPMTGTRIKKIKQIIKEKGYKEKSKCRELGL